MEWKQCKKVLEITALLNVTPSGLAGTNIYKNLPPRFSE